MYFGAAYYPEHRDPDKWDVDLDWMARASVNCLRIGEFAWKRMEPQAGSYRFDWLLAFLDKAWQRQIRVLLCPPLRTLPSWLVEAEPGVRLVNSKGLILTYGSRYSFCINHPALQRHGTVIARELAKACAGHPAVAGWHLDNEHGDEPDCHCPVCEAKFQQWCAQRYQSVDTLNARWGLVFWGLELDRFDQIQTPKTSKTHFSPGHLLAWRRFRHASTVAAIRMQAHAVREFAGDGQFFTTNHQGWNGRTDYFDAGRELDISGTNYYPSFGDGSAFTSADLARCRAYKQQGFQVHELRSGPHMVPDRSGNTPAPGEVERLALHCIGHGADALFFFRWRACPFGCEQTHGSLTDHDGRPGRVYEEAARVFARCARLVPLLAQSRVQSDVAVLLDFQTRWVMEANQEWTGPAGLYMQLVDGCYHAVRAAGYNCDFVQPDGDLQRYRVLLVPALAVVDDARMNRLADFVEQGGVLIWHPLCGIKDMDAQIFPDRLHPRLQELLGVELSEFATPDGTPFDFQWRGERFTGDHFCELPRATGASIEGAFTSHWFAGAPAVLRNKAGRGETVYVSTFPEAAFYAPLLRELRLPPTAPVFTAPLPPGMEMVSRTMAEGSSLLFLINTRNVGQYIEQSGTFEDVYHEETLTDRIEFSPFAVRVLRISP